MTPFKSLITLAGLSQKEAGEYLDARLDTVKSWSSGRNSAPGTVIDELCGLIHRQMDAANEALDIVESLAEKHGWPEAIEISVTKNWPCEGARGAVFARVAAGLPESQKFSFAD